MEQGDFKKFIKVISRVIKAATKGTSGNSYHALMTAFDYRNEIGRTYELTVNTKGNTLIAVLARKDQEIEKKDKFTFYYETYESVLGLPFTNIQKGPLEDEDITPELIEYVRQYLLKSALVMRGSSKGLQSITLYITAACTAIKAVCGAYKEIVSAFKTTNTETIKEMIKGEGFSSFAQKSRFIRSLGVPNAKFDVYINAYMTLTGLKKSKYREEIEAVCTIGQWLEDSSWAMNDFTFDENSGGLVGNVITLTRNNLIDQVTHFITVNLTGSFKLAPDVLVISKHKSVAGGIFENTKDIRKTIPRTISNDEVRAIQSLMIMNSMKIMADSFDVPFSFPNDDPNKL